MLFRKLLFVCFLLNLFLSPVHAQETEITIDSANLRRQAMEMAASFMKADYKAFTKFTYPKVVAMMGGEEKMIHYLKQGIEQMKKDGFAFQSVRIKLTGQKVRAGKEIHTLVSQDLLLTVPGGTLTTSSYLLAISLNNGRTWYFLDTAPFSDTTKLKAVLLHYNAELKIPEKPQPLFTATK